MVTAQKNELSGLIGRTIISNQGIQGSTVSDNLLRFGNGLSFEANYARRVMGTDLLSLVVLCLLVAVGKGEILGRLGDLRPGIRLDISKDYWKMFLRRPVLGWGMGTFPTGYPGYRSFYTNDFINEAHDDYAQLFVRGWSPWIWGDDMVPDSALSTWIAQVTSLGI